MPVYRFMCPVCGVEFEKRLSYQTVTDEATCPNGHVGARRVFSAPAVLYKGSGFYVTDHRRKPAGEKGSD